MLDRWLGFAGLIGLLIVLAVAAPAGAAEDDFFTVSGVHEDVTAASALAARDEAQANGQQRAFATLMGRIANGKAPHVGAAQITDLVAGFEVANERTSSVRYVADYTFHFKPGAIRRLLQDSSLTYIEPAKPVVVLPVYSEDGRAVLWDDPNPWRDAWAAHASEGALPIVVPVGDLPDVSVIDAPKAIAGDIAALRGISARYRNDDVLVAQGKLVAEPHRFDVKVTRYSMANPEAPRTLTVTTAGKPDESENALMARAVVNTIAQLGQSWKAANTFDPGSGGTLNATVPSGVLSDWIAVRNRLRGIPAVRSTELVSFDRTQIHIAIHYAGDLDRLRAALRDRGLDLSGSDPDWVLAPVAAAPAKEPANEPAGAADATPPPGSAPDPLRQAAPKP